MSDNHFLDTTIIGGGAIKALGGGLVRGLAVPFTSPAQKDAHQQYFSGQTNLRRKGYPIKNAPVLYHHGLSQKFGVDPLTTVGAVEVDAAGVWAQVQLDLSDPQQQDVYKDVEAGKLFWSSGALPQSVKVNPDGHITDWSVIEISLTPTPAMKHLTRITSVKALSDMQGDIAPAGMEDEDGTPVENTTTALSDNTSHKETIKMDAQLPVTPGIPPAAPHDPSQIIVAKLDEILTYLRGQGDPTYNEGAMRAALTETLTGFAAGMKSDSAADVATAIDAALPTIVADAAKRAFAAHEAQKAAILKGMNDARAAQPVALKSDAAGGFNGGGNNNPPVISVSENLKYARLTAAEMLTGAQIMNAHHNPTNRPGVTLSDIGLSETYLKHMAQKSARVADEQAALGNWSMKAILPFKADELNATDITGQGAEWVGNFNGEDFWETPRGNRIWDRMVQAGMRVRDLPQGYGTYEMLAEGTDPIVYSPPQANDMDATTKQPEVTIKQSPFGTVDQTVTPGKMGARVIVTTELIEDSLVPILPQVNRQMRNTLLDHRDKLLINGDTVITASTNINLIDGTPGTGDARPYYLAASGIRKYGLVTNASTAAVDGAGATGLSLWRVALSKLRPEFWEDTSRLVFVTNSLTLQGTLAYPELATFGVAGQYATIVDGIVQRLFGIPVIGTSRLPLANTVGKVSATAANNVTGTIICMYPDALVAVIKREVTLKTFEYIRSDATEFVATTRLGFGFRDATSVGIVYNVGNTAATL